MQKKTVFCSHHLSKKLSFFAFFPRFFLSMLRRIYEKQKSIKKRNFSSLQCYKERKKDVFLRGK